MKKLNKAFWAFGIWGIVAVLAGCSQAIPASNLPQDITMGTGGSRSDAGQESTGGNGAAQESETPGQSEQKNEEGAFGFIYEGVTLTPGEVFEQSMPGECLGVAEVPSCAFDGNDMVYNYGIFELTAYIDEEQERIYSIYFIDPNLPTTEGLCMGDTVDDMKSLYGEDYETAGNSYDYTRGDTVLSIITQNDVVVGIEYRLNR